MVSFLDAAPLHSLILSFVSSGSQAKEGQESRDSVGLAEGTMCNVQLHCATMMSTVMAVARMQRGMHEQRFARLRQRCRGARWRRRRDMEQRHRAIRHMHAIVETLLQ